MAISLNDHENRIRSFEGKLPGIENRINSLVASAKSWVKVTCNRSGNAFNYPSQYSSWDFIVIGGFMGYVGDCYVNCQPNGGVQLRPRSINTGMDYYYFTWRKTSTQIVPNYTGELKSSITVLFYK